jgi:hypothetical protein
MIKVREKGISIDVEALGLEDKLEDTTFLNEIQAGVNKWIKEIQKVTRLVGYDELVQLCPSRSVYHEADWCSFLVAASRCPEQPCKKSTSGAT